MTRLAVRALASAFSCATADWPRAVSARRYNPKLTKVAAIKGAGAEVRFHGVDGLDTENFARQYSVEKGMEYLSPYNDAAVIAGQGTCGVEISRQLPNVDAIFIAVGGGGLIAGVATFLKSVNPKIEIVSCQPSASRVMRNQCGAAEYSTLKASQRYRMAQQVESNKMP